jgi:hypothetical protein
VLRASFDHSVGFYPVSVREGATMSTKQQEDYLIDWRLHKVLHRMKSLASSITRYIIPVLELVFAASEEEATTETRAGGHGDDDNHHDNDDCLYCLIVEYYEAVRLGLSDDDDDNNNGDDDDDRDGLKQMVLLKWIFMLGRLAEESGPLPFPVTCCALWEDSQWLPGRQLLWHSMTDFMPFWNFPLAEFSLDDIPSRELELKDWMKAVNGFLFSFIDDICQRNDSWDILPVLMGWILCPVTLGWHYINWDVPFPDSLEAKKCQLWQVFDHLQKLLGRQQSEILQLLEILKWATRLSAIIYFDSDWPQDEDDMLENLSLFRSERERDGWMDESSLPPPF